MTRRMADSIYSASIPVGKFPLVAGYINGSISRWSQADWDRHAGHSILVRVTVFASTNDGHVLDVENGDATPVQAPPWVRMRRMAGFRNPTIYCSESVWTTVQAEFARQGVAPPNWWVAAYPGERDAGGNPLIPAGAIAHQYADPATSGGQYDLSVVADHWPGVDPGGTVSLNQDDANGLSTTVWSIKISSTDSLYAYLKTIGYVPDAGGVITVSIPFGQMMLYNFLRLSQLANSSSGVLSKLDVAVGEIKSSLLSAIAALGSFAGPTDAQMADLETKLTAALPSYTVSITKA